ncbi:Myb DNA-bind 3 domain-containing protein [Abeliophyllum distichum]|uniref:Myb DNA-bind 3 domain-containing protein n=1 Tax=Abeliophyllum distichum TaxID=126358 RepID=A0ABD1RBK8_9LAMI
MNPFLLHLRKSIHRTGKSTAVKPTSPVRKNAKWAEQEHQIFLTACETVITKGHRKEKCFRKYDWERLVNLFNSSTAKNWSHSQLKNHSDSMKRKHNHLDNVIVADDEWWSEKSSGDKQKGSVRRSEDKSKNIGSVDLSYLVEYLTSVGEALAASRQICQKEVPSCLQCIKDLTAMGKVPKGSALYNFVLTFLVNRKNRKGFATTEEPEYKLGWIQYNFKQSHDEGEHDENEYEEQLQEDISLWLEFYRMTDQAVRDYIRN